MHLHDQRGCRIDSASIVLEMRPVGGADLDQPRSRPRHDLRHPEGAADLDQLTARNDGCAVRGQRIEHQEHCGRIVVDDDGVLGSCQLAHEAADDVVTLAASAGCEFELERRRMAHRACSGGDGRFGQHRAAEVGVQHGAGEIEHAAQPGRIGRLEPDQRRLGNAPRQRLAIKRWWYRCGPVTQSRSHRLEQDAKRIHRGGTAKTGGRNPSDLAAEDLVDGGDRTCRCSHVVSGQPCLTLPRAIARIDDEHQTRHGNGRRNDHSIAGA